MAPNWRRQTHWWAPIITASHQYFGRLHVHTPIKALIFVVVVRHTWSILYPLTLCSFIDLSVKFLQVPPTRTTAARWKPSYRSQQEHLTNYFNFVTMAESHSEKLKTVHVNTIKDFSLCNYKSMPTQALVKVLVTPSFLRELP
jgi:hypothetical protein